MFEPDFAEIGDRIRKRRLELHLTQENVAKAIEVNVSHVSNIENNKVKVSLTLFAKICQVLHTSMDYIVFDSMPNAETSMERELLINTRSLSEDRQDLLLDISRTMCEREGK